MLVLNIKYLLFPFTGQFVNLNADTVIQYFSSSENREEDGRSSKPVVVETKINLETTLPSQMKNVNNAIISSDLANSFTTESSKQTKVHINSKARVKLSLPTRKRKSSKSEQTAPELKKSESFFSSMKDLFIPTKRNKANLSKIESFQRKGHVIPRSSNLPTESVKSTVRKVQGTLREMKNIKYTDLQRKSSTAPSPLERTKFNFDSWYRKQTVEICGSGWQDKYRK